MDVGRQLACMDN